MQVRLFTFRPHYAQVTSSNCPTSDGRSRSLAVGGTRAQ